jgi:hypothetical protein
MYAALMNLTIDPALASAAASAFTNEILPRVLALQGSSPDTGWILWTARASVSCCSTRRNMRSS